MKTHAQLLVTALSLVDEDESQDAGLVHVVAESVRDDAIQSVTFLGNLKDAWYIGQKVHTIVWWPSEDAEEDGEEHVLDRPFSAGGLDPAAFTEEAVNGARFVEPDENF